MTHSLIGFASTENSINTQYIKNQLQAIEDAIPGLTTEFANQHDTRLRSLVKRADRLPCIVLLKNNTRKAVIHGKLDTNYAIKWTKGHIG